jgi:5-methylcytosine-specific restriction endonuclease McrA
MDAQTRRLVRERAENRCEYCHLRQSAAPFFAFHTEHIRAQQHGGTGRLENLALACPDCNAHKGPNLTSIDPQSDQYVPLFNPRVDRWEQHFVVEGPFITGRTPIGRATVALLAMNEPERVQMRAELQHSGDL